MSSSNNRALVAGGVLVASLAVSVLVAAERSYPVDCLPDRVTAFEPVATNPNSLFGAPFLPGVLLGPPGDSVPLDGSATVAAFGYGGRATVQFQDIVIEDRPGPDFIVFENVFFLDPVPSSASDPFRVFAEPGIVEVSADGETWTAFPYDAQALAAAGALSAGATIDRALYLDLVGLAGITPTFSGNWTVPNDPTQFDDAGTGGVSGAGGDAFDLATVGLTEARFVRITDGGTSLGFAGAGAGFDLDAVVALHARPLPPGAPDTDGDRLSDEEELTLHGSNPALFDSDGDGIDDGREVAGCRDPGSSSLDPFVHGEPRLWALGAICTELRWSPSPGATFYEVVRSDLAALSVPGWLGGVDCLAPDQLGLRFSCDIETPDPANPFYYLVRPLPLTGYGRSGTLELREASTSCP
ncbi:MAG: hypothetical protein GY716_24580 [bacterium]|nr:hypothetical protein [bacterium]